MNGRRGGLRRRFGRRLRCRFGRRRRCRLCCRRRRVMAYVNNNIASAAGSACKTKAKAIISAANRSNFFFIICLLNKVRRRSASPRKKRLRQRRVNSPPRELRSRGWFSCLFPSGMFPEKQADSRLRLHNSKLNKPAREQFAVLPRTGNKKRFLCGTVTRTGADGFCRSAFNPAE